MVKKKRIKGLLIALIILAATTFFPQQTKAFDINDTINQFSTYFVPKIAAKKSEAALPKGYRSCSGLEEASSYLRERICSYDKKIKLSFALDKQPDFEELTEDLRWMTCKHTGKPTEGDYILYQTGFEYSAEIYQDGDSYLYYMTVTPIYFMTKEQEEKVTEKVSKLLKSLKLDGKTNYEKVKLIYDYIVENVSYDRESDKRDGYIAYSAYAALIEGKAVCQGYANLLYRLCLESGIDCRIVSGSCDGEGHAWNIIRIGDYYYHADATWDAVRKKYEYFLKCPDNITDHVLNKQYDNTSFFKEHVFGEKDCTPDAENVTVTFDAKGGTSPIAEKKLQSGEKLNLIPFPAKENAIFTGWYTNGGKAFKRGSRVVSSIRLIAGWEKEHDNSGLHRQLSTKNGTELSTDSTGKTTVIVFGDIESSQKTRKIITDMAKSEYAKGRFIYVDILDNGSKAGYSVANSFLQCPYSEDNASVCWNYRKELIRGVNNLTLPYVVIINAEDNIVFANAAGVKYAAFKDIVLDSLETAMAG